MYVCTVCMHVYMYICMYVCMNVCIYVCIYVCMYICMLILFYLFYLPLLSNNSSLLAYTLLIVDGIEKKLLI